MEHDENCEADWGPEGQESPCRCEKRKHFMERVARFKLRWGQADADGLQGHRVEYALQEILEAVWDEGAKAATTYYSDLDNWITAGKAGIVTPMPTYPTPPYKDLA